MKEAHEKEQVVFPLLMPPNTTLKDNESSKWLENLVKEILAILLLWGLQFNDFVWDVLDTKYYDKVFDW